MELSMLILFLISLWLVKLECDSRSNEFGFIMAIAMLTVSTIGLIFC